MADYSTYSKEELLKLIAKQEKELKAKKYGLVWDAEREPEQVVLDCENNLPVLERIKSKEIRTDDSEDNILIEGDNYHALTVLNYTHKEKIDVIYIDPPYNTGAKDWKYNNNYVGEDDGFRHSKWLNLLEKRLNNCVSLLAPNGIICVTIDDYELPRLWLLMEKIFGEHNHLGTLAIRINPGGRKSKRKIAAQHEYALYFSKNTSTEIAKVIKSHSEKSHNYKKDKNGTIYEERNLRKEGADSLANKGSERYYPIYFDKNSGQLSTSIKLDTKILPIDTNGEKRIWRRGKDKIDEMWRNGDIFIKKTKFGLQVYFKFIGGLKGETPKSFWDNPQYSASEHGTQILDSILGKRETFPFPKSLYAVMESIKIASNKDDLTVLDFFAGSGTTGQAVMELNKQDNGKRKFILCTNNENNICEDVTYPRVKNVIKGYDFKGKDKTVLFEKKITWTDLNKHLEIIVENINAIIDENKDKYNKIEKEFKDNTIKIMGVKIIDSKKDGLSGNLQYFKTSLIKKKKNRDQVKVDLTRRCTEMLCVKENIFNLETESDDYKIFSSNKKNEFLCVYYNFIENTFNDFLEELKKWKGKKHIYMFSMENEIDKNLFAGVKNIKIEAIPQNILDVYKQLVKMNIPVKTNIIFTDLSKAKNKIFTDKDKDDGARVLRVVLEKLIQKISQDNSINILNAKGKEERISNLNDNLLNKNVITKIEWQENRTYLTIGNNAAHGDYDDYELKQVEKFYQHIQSLLNNYNV